MSASDIWHRHPRLAAFAVGVATPLVITTICRITGTWQTNWWYLVAAAAYISVGVLVWCGSVRATAITALLAYIAIPFGVVIDAIVDFSVWSVDRNLFPFEIIFLFVIVPLPLALGVFLGSMLRSNLLPNTDARQEPPRAG